MAGSRVLHEADVVVIGAGALGSSAAFHLAARGDRRVAIVEKFEAASQTSPRAAGLTQQIALTEARSRIATRSCEKIARFAEETGEPMEFTVSGSVKLARTEDHVQQVRDEAARAKQWGIRVELVAPGDVPKLSPFVSPRGVLAAWHNPDDIYLEPVQIPRGYTRAAVKRGATLFEGTGVTGLLLENGRVAGAATTAAACRPCRRTAASSSGRWTTCPGFTFRPAATSAGYRPRRRSARRSRS